MLSDLDDETQKKTSQNQNSQWLLIFINQYFFTNACVKKIVLDFYKEMYFFVSNKTLLPRFVGIFFLLFFLKGTYGSNWEDIYDYEKNWEVNGNELTKETYRRN